MNWLSNIWFVAVIFILVNGHFRSFQFLRILRAVDYRLTLLFTPSLAPSVPLLSLYVLNFTFQDEQCSAGVYHKYILGHTTSALLSLFFDIMHSWPGILKQIDKSDPQLLWPYVTTMYLVKHFRISAVCHLGKVIWKLKFIKENKWHTAF